MRVDLRGRGKSQWFWWRWSRSRGKAATGPTGPASAARFLHATPSPAGSSTPPPPGDDPRIALKLTRIRDCGTTGPTDHASVLRSTDATPIPAGQRPRLQHDLLLRGEGHPSRRSSGSRTCAAAGSVVQSRFLGLADRSEYLWRYCGWIRLFWRSNRRLRSACPGSHRYSP